MTVVSKVGISLDRGQLLQAATRALLKTEVLVGVPDSEADRKLDPGEEKPISNSTIAYVQEFGSDEHNIPPRPFLIPGVISVKDKITGELAAAGIIALNGGTTAQVEAPFYNIGFMAAQAAQQKITDGGYAPLSERTIRARADRRTPKGKQSTAHSSKEAREYLRLMGEGVPIDILSDAGLATPLLDTRQMFRAITFVVKSKG